MEEKEIERTILDDARLDQRLEGTLSLVLLDTADVLVVLLKKLELVCLSFETSEKRRERGQISSL
jgi:hypothetical protein